LSNEEKTKDYENFEKGMIYMKILKKGGVVEKRREEEAKSMPHASINFEIIIQLFFKLLDDISSSSVFSAPQQNIY
jgi:hypothetical protein